MASKRSRKFHRKWNAAARANAKRNPVSKLKIFQPPVYPHRALFPGEISRTEFKQLDLRQEIIAGKKGPIIDPNSHCTYCKNQDTTRVVDAVALEPFAVYYHGRPFRVFSCHCCGAVWSHEVISAALEAAA